MKQVEVAPSIRVLVPRAGEVQGRVLTIPHRTALFRHDAFLAEVLQLAVERAPDPTGLSVASVACSTGAEVDSLLALYNDSGRQGGITITGYDASQRAVEAARRGLYKLHHPGFSETEGQGKFLQEKGFTISYEPLDHPLLKCATVIADAAPVRRGHEVRFVEHDATEVLPAAREVDLALANNLLYHLDADKATRVACNMAGILSDRGVLSFGTNVALGGETRESVTRVLHDKFGLEPAVTDMENILIYARA